jgi:hypothetical protein
MEIDGGHYDAFDRQRSVDAGIIGSIAVVPRAAVHVDDGRKWSCPFGLIDASQPGLPRLALILDIPHVYFEFVFAGHAGNLQPRRVALQAQQLIVQRERKAACSFVWSL